MKICNVCGKEIAYDEDGISIEHFFGYESNFDGAALNMDLCAACSEKLVEMVRPTCKHDPLSYFDRHEEN